MEICVLAGRKWREAARSHGHLRTLGFRFFFLVILIFLLFLLVFPFPAQLVQVFCDARGPVPSRPDASGRLFAPAEGTAGQFHRCGLVSRSLCDSARAANFVRPSSPLREGRKAFRGLKKKPAPE